jgi:hypothetical protein
MVSTDATRVRRITLAVAATIAGLVLLLSYRTSTSGRMGTVAATPGGAPPGIVTPGAAPAPTTGTPPSGTLPSGAPPSGASPSGAPSPGVRPDPATVTVNGTTVDNGYGPVQVQVIISAGQITDVRTLALPTDGHSRRINDYAVPVLRQEVLRAQSARVDAVSGATDTSLAYTRSLQAALDAAHLAGR